MAPELTFTKLFKCPFKACNLSFATQADYWAHRRMEHEHCDKCDVDCEDWDAFVKHKAQSDRHISCAVCGQDFGSEGGMKLHVRQMHQRAQKLACNGCGVIFGRAGAFVAHIEQNQCKNHKDKSREIKKSDLDDSYHRKTIIENYLHQTPSLARSFAPLDSPSVSAAESLASAEGGGVGIKNHLGAIDENINEAYPALQPTVSRVDKKLAAPTWNTTPNAALSNKASNASAKDKLATDDDKVTVTASTEPSAWNKPTASTLFPSAKPTPMNQSFAQGLAALDTEYGQQSNMLHARFWDPKAKGYSPENFFNQLIERYECPWPNCTFQTTSPNMISNHLGDPKLHVNRRHDCPSCLRIFKSASALISHCESASTRCNIRNSTKYAQHIDRISGGYVSVVKNESESLSGPEFGTATPKYGW